MKSIPKYIVDRFGNGAEKKEDIEKEFQKALFTAYKGLKQVPDLDLVIIDLMSKAGLNRELTDSEYTLEKLCKKEGQKEIVYYLLQKLELTEIDFLKDLGG